MTYNFRHLEINNNKMNLIRIIKRKLKLIKIIY